MSTNKKNTWQPVKHSIIKYDLTKEIIHKKGFYIQPLLTEKILCNLEEIYSKFHHFEDPKGGMFYSIYSQDIDYRKKIHNEIRTLIEPFLDDHFHDFKVMLCSFVVKLPGEKSEFYIHQDTTGMDEWEDSPLTVWIPLQNVDEGNGCLGVIPFSHGFFSPYRSISFPSPFEQIQSTVRNYLQPVDMKRGEALFFDNRIVHHSYANQTKMPRIAVVCGLFPKNAKLITCHKPTYTHSGKIEIIEHPDDYLLTGKNFLIDCQKRPENGKHLKWTDDNYASISSAEFELLCQDFGIKPFKRTSDNFTAQIECNMIGEPKNSPTVPSSKGSLSGRLNNFISKLSGNNNRVSEFEIFQSYEQASSLRKNGVICVPFLDEDGLKLIDKIYDKTNINGVIPSLSNGIHMTIWHHDTSYKLNIREELEKVLTPYFEKIFKNYRAISQQFIIKMPGKETTFPIHQDWNIVDESKYFSLNIWIPLHDVDENNGAMWIVKGSHKLNQPIRGAGNLFPNYHTLINDLGPYMTNYPMKAGEALIFYHSTIHGSPANTSNEPRKIVQVSVLPKEAPMQIYFQPPGTNTVEIHNPEDNFNFLYNNIREESEFRSPTDNCSGKIANYKLKSVSIKSIRKIQNK